MDYAQRENVQYDVLLLCIILIIIVFLVINNIFSSLCAENGIFLYSSVALCKPSLELFGKKVFLVYC